MVELGELAEAAKLEAEVLTGDWDPPLSEILSVNCWDRGEGGAKLPLRADSVGEGKFVGLLRGIGAAGAALRAASR